MAALPNIDIDEMYATLCQLDEENAARQFTTAGGPGALGMDEATKEHFWREMEHCDDPFDVISRYMAKGYLETV